MDITVNVSDERYHLRLHTKKLDIRNTKLYKDIKAGKNEVDLLESFEYVDNEYWVVKSNGQIGPGTYIISMGEPNFRDL